MKKYRIKKIQLPSGTYKFIVERLWLFIFWVKECSYPSYVLCDEFIRNKMEITKHPKYRIVEHPNEWLRFQVEKYSTTFKCEWIFIWSYETMEEAMACIERRLERESGKTDDAVCKVYY